LLDTEVADAVLTGRDAHGLRLIGRAESEHNSDSGDAFRAIVTNPNEEVP
jgi:hypothetical protein